MSVRNNEDRVGAHAPASSSPPPQEQENRTESFSFTVPTEFVDLPSKGKYYPAGHPLCNSETVEIKYMTAKDEDILTSKSLIKKGLAIDRLLQNVVVDKNIDINSLLIGDKNALIVAARITGYGSDYETRITCPVCSTTSEHSFDLSDVDATSCLEDLDKFNVEVDKTNNNTFVFDLPKTGVKVEVSFLVGKDEKKLAIMSERRKKNNLPESTLTDQFKMIIVSVNGNADREIINTFVNNLPAIDSRFLRVTYAKLTPNVDLSYNFECPECNYENKTTIPFTEDFFWPSQ
jgi:rubredoxin